MITTGFTKKLVLGFYIFLYLTGPIVSAELKPVSNDLKSWVWIKRGHVPASRCRLKCFICESGAAGSTIVIQTHKSHSTQTSRQQDKRQTSETQTINKAILCWDLPLSGHTSALKCCFDNIQSGRTAWFRGVAVREFNWGDT